MLGGNIYVRGNIVVNKMDNLLCLHPHQVYSLYDETGQETDKYMADQMLKSAAENIDAAKRTWNSEV